MAGPPRVHHGKLYKKTLDSPEKSDSMGPVTPATGWHPGPAPSGPRGTQVDAGPTGRTIWTLPGQGRGPRAQRANDKRDARKADPLPAGYRERGMRSGLQGHAGWNGRNRGPTPPYGGDRQKERGWRGPNRSVVDYIPVAQKRSGADTAPPTRPKAGPKPQTGEIPTPPAYPSRGTRP